MMRMKSPKSVSDGAKRTGSGEELSARRKRQFWMKRILISLVKRIPNGSAKPLHRYLYRGKLWDPS
jgi:hypothetical protein